MRAAAAPEAETSDLPPLFRHHVRRPRLTRMLDASSAPVIVLTAPAGYGKTTLAAEWLQGRPKDRVAWYYATPASADVAAFSIGLAEAVSHIVPAGDRVRQRLRVPQIPEDVAEILAELLAEDLAEWPEDAWLVVDDYHHVMESKPSERFMAELLRLAPVRVLITTRRRPGWLSARRALYESVTELVSAHLTMNREESVRVLGRPSKPCALPAEKTEGWPAVVGLAALVQCGRLHDHQATPTLFTFFADEILRAETAETRNVMLAASLLPQIDYELLERCPWLMDVSVHLDHIDRIGLLQRRAGQSTFHPLLRDFLRNHLYCEQPELAGRLADLAFSYYLQRGDWDSAFDLLQVPRDADRVVEVIRLAAYALLGNGRIETLMTWCEAAGDALLADEQATVAYAEALVRTGAFARAERVVYGEHGDETRVSNSPALTGLLGQIAYLKGDYLHAMRLHEQAFTRARTPDERVRAAWGSLLAAVELDHEAQVSHLQRFSRLAPHDANSQARVASAEVMVKGNAGSYQGSSVRLQSARTLIPLADDPLAISVVLFLSAHFSIARSDYLTARRYAEEGRCYARTLRLKFTEAYFLTSHVSASVGLRDFGEATRAMRELQTIANESEDPYIQLESQNLALKAALAQDAPNALAALVQNEAIPHTKFFRWLRAEHAALSALAHAAAGDSDAALTLSDAAEHLSSQPTVRCLADYSKLVINVQEHGVTPILATELVSTTLRAVDLECTDPLVVTYRACPNILPPLATHPRTRGIVLRILNAANDATVAQGLGLPLLTPTHRPGSPLTKREREVMELVAAGLTNAEISERLYIALSTTKVHVRHILRKLGARNRVETVLRWRELEQSSDLVGDERVRIPPDSTTQDSEPTREHTQPAR